ncbi:hypothetical protein BLNAU_7129 [Blattamonas nauphoetae]|uniref:Uncharacterized protein n=1 Tax=Blattamonas nauphoetae TaxID=2049346 RepID=A0ABQ9Y2N4_9EUKA|nr:hypothetical protein BLNAU_7129 [Blattamonas nauphoetae]
MHPLYLIKPVNILFPIIFWPIFGTCILSIVLYYIELFTERQRYRTRCPRVYRVSEALVRWPAYLYLKVVRWKNKPKTDKATSNVLFRRQLMSLYDLNGIVKRFEKFHQKQMKREPKSPVVKKAPVRRMEPDLRTPLLKKDEGMTSSRKTGRLNDEKVSSALKELHPMYFHRMILTILCVSPNEPIREMSLKLIAELE